MTTVFVPWASSVRKVFLHLSHLSETISPFRKINPHHKKKRVGRHFCSRASAGLPHFLVGRRRKRRGSLAVSPSRSNTADLRIIDTNNNSSSSNSQSRTVEIPVTCYQIVGVLEQAEKDEIVKSVIDLKNAEIDEGYTQDAAVSRENLLLDVRDKLMFEPEYAGSIMENVPPKSSLRIPWSWLPGALCLLQEVGEEKLVLDIGREALQHPSSKPYVHDLLLSMALAECAIATVCFEKNKISQVFEALARSQCLLMSKISLQNMKLLYQIEQYLEVLAPECTMEFLGMPLAPENAERRLRAIAALRELLRQGLDVEASCQVQDWPCFLSQALNKLMATEIVNLLPWDNLAVTRKNKKSFESQNQRVVIDLNSFYMALTAHIALGFSSKQTHLINKARTICECLIASEGIDLKFEEAFCLFLLGQADEAEAVKKLQKLALNMEPASENLIAGKNAEKFPSANLLLETWLKDNVLSTFPDTRDCSPSLANFFVGGKKASGIGHISGSSQTVLHVNPRPLSAAFASDQKALDEPLSYANYSRNDVSAVKLLAPSKLQGALTVGKASNESNATMPRVELKRNLGAHHEKIWRSLLDSCNVVRRIAFVMALGCILFATLKLSALQLWRVRSSTRWASGKAGIVNFSHDRNLVPACINENSTVYKLKKLTSVFKMRLGKNHPDDANLQNSPVAASLSSSVTAVYKRPMPMEDAESLVKQWQTIKAEALGPGHKVHSLFQVLDGPILAQWQALAEEAKNRSCFWRFVLLQLSVIRAEILSDVVGAEMAEIEALLEEAAELVDDTQLKNPNYYSVYRIRYVLKRQDDSWRFCEGDIQTP